GSVAAEAQHAGRSFGLGDRERLQHRTRVLDRVARGLQRGRSERRRRPGALELLHDGIPLDPVLLALLRLGDGSVAIEYRNGWPTGGRLDWLRGGRRLCTRESRDARDDTKQVQAHPAHDESPWLISRKLARHAHSTPPARRERPRLSSHDFVVSSL